MYIPRFMDITTEFIPQNHHYSNYPLNCKNAGTSCKTNYNFPQKNHPASIPPPLRPTWNPLSSNISSPTRAVMRSHAQPCTSPPHISGQLPLAQPCTSPPHISALPCTSPPHNPGTAFHKPTPRACWGFSGIFLKSFQGH